MTIRFFMRTAAITAALAFLMTGSGDAATITFNTNAAGTGFGGTSLSLNSAFGAAATLTFIPRPSTPNGVPSSINFGTFTLVCATCSEQAVVGGSSAFFNPFVFDLVITDETDGFATGKFVGNSTGGLVHSDASQITIIWSPLQFGPGTNNATSGNFGPTTFSTTSFTGIVAPNSGAAPGQSTVQGYIDTELTDEVPEPAALSLVGFAFLALGLVRRSRQSGE